MELTESVVSVVLMATIAILATLFAQTVMPELLTALDWPAACAGSVAPAEDGAVARHGAAGERSGDSRRTR